MRFRILPILKATQAPAAAAVLNIRVNEKKLTELARCGVKVLITEEGEHLPTPQSCPDLHTNTMRYTQTHTIDKKKVSLREKKNKKETEAKMNLLSIQLGQLLTSLYALTA